MQSTVDVATRECWKEVGIPIILCGNGFPASFQPALQAFELIGRSNDSHPDCARSVGRTEVGGPVPSNSEFGIDVAVSPAKLKLRLRKHLSSHDSCFPDRRLARRG